MSENLKASAVAGTDLPNSQSGRADGSENIRSYQEIQAQHLAVIFGLPAETAVTVAELAFAGCPR